MKISYAPAARDNGTFAIDTIPGYDPKAIYVGVADRAVAHFYVIIGNTRIDYSSGFRSPIIRTSKNGPPLASKGVVFKLSVDAETFESFDTDPGGWGRASCMHGARCHLAQNGIQLMPPTSWITSAGASTSLLSGHVRMTDGRPIPIEMFASSPAAVRTFVRETASGDERVPQHLLNALGGVGKVLQPMEPVLRNLFLRLLNIAH